MVIIVSNESTVRPKTEKMLSERVVIYITRLCGQTVKAITVLPQLSCFLRKGPFCLALKKKKKTTTRSLCAHLCYTTPDADKQQHRLLQKETTQPATNTIL